MRHAAALVLLALTGCASNGSVMPRALPPELIRVPVPTYVPIPDTMTARCAWVDEAPPSEVFRVAAGRKTCLRQYETQLRAIERVTGQAVPR